jgi:hypothetical protein
MHHLPLHYEAMDFVTLLSIHYLQACLILAINTDFYSQNHHSLEVDGFPCEAGLKVYVGYYLG